MTGKPATFVELEPRMAHSVCVATAACASCGAYQLGTAKAKNKKAKTKIR
jgi:hypothetical protein